MRLVRNIARLLYLVVSKSSEGAGYWLLFLLIYFRNNPTCDIATAARWACLYTVPVAIIVQLVGWISEE